MRPLCLIFSLLGCAHAATLTPASLFWPTGSAPVEKVVIFRPPSGAGALGGLEVPPGFGGFLTDAVDPAAYEIHLQPQDTTSRHSGLVYLLLTTGEHVAGAIAVDVGPLASRPAPPPVDFRTTFHLGPVLLDGLDALRAAAPRVISLPKAPLRSALISLCEMSGISFLLRDIPELELSLATNATPFLVLESVCRERSLTLDYSPDGLWIISTSAPDNVFGVTYSLGGTSLDEAAGTDILETLRNLATRSGTPGVVKRDVSTNTVFVLTRRTQHADIRDYLAGIVRVARPSSIDMRFVRSRPPLTTLLDFGWHPAESRPASGPAGSPQPHPSITVLTVSEASLDEGLLWVAAEHGASVTSWDTLAGNVRLAFQHTTSATGGSTTATVTPLRREAEGEVVLLSLRGMGGKLLFQDTYFLPDGSVLAVCGLEAFPLDVTGPARWGFYSDGAVLGRSYWLIRRTPGRQGPVTALRASNQAGGIHPPAKAQPAPAPL